MSGEEKAEGPGVEETRYSCSKPLLARDLFFGMFALQINQVGHCMEDLAVNWAASHETKSE